jgi:aryl-phospho-beta-D-glucosidase BglC (GH1 family)
MLTLLRALACLMLAACDDDVAPARMDLGGRGAGSDLAAGPRPRTGYLRTRGRDLVDENGDVVRLTGLSWFGLETPSFAPHGLHVRSMGSILDQVKSLGFNMIRIPFSTQLLDAGSTPTGIDFAKNPDLAGTSGLGLIDKIVDGAAARGLKVILDRHRPDAYAQSDLWYTAQYSEARWIADWQRLARHYAGDGTVVGFDLHSEPRGAASWGDGNAATDWRLAAERAGNAILTVNPDLLVIVEGVQYTGGSGYWWGGNLSGVAGAPVRLHVADRVVYSPHDYPPSVNDQPWFHDPSYPSNLPSVWDANWGSVAQSGLAPIWIGEFGTRYQTSADQAWLLALARYITDNRLSFAFWCLNPDSTDTGGILMDDWQTAIAQKMAVLQPLLAPPVP